MLRGNILSEIPNNIRIQIVLQTSSLLQISSGDRGPVRPQFIIILLQRCEVPTYNYKASQGVVGMILCIIFFHYETDCGNLATSCYVGICLWIVTVTI